MSVPPSTFPSIEKARLRERKGHDMGTRVFVGNISFETSEQDLHDLFASDGRSVASVNIVTDRISGRSRGFAFVEMAPGTEMPTVIGAMDGRELHGRALRVSEAHERAERPQRRGPPHSGGFRKP